MPGPLEVFRNVLELERQKNYKNSSVSGGMANFVSFFEKPEVKSAINPENIQTLSIFLTAYDELNDADRRKAVESVLNWLEDNPTGNLNNRLSLPKYKSTNKKSSVEKSNPPIGQDPALYASVKSIRGIGDRNIQIFKKLGIERIIDLLRYFPRRYQDYSNLKTIDRVEYGV